MTDFESKNVDFNSGICYITNATEKRAALKYNNPNYKLEKSLLKFIKKNIDINNWICYITNATEKGASKWSLKTK